MKNFKKLYLVIFMIIGTLISFNIEKAYALDEIKFGDIKLYKYVESDNESLFDVNLDGTKVGVINNICSFNPTKKDYSLQNLNQIYLKPNIDCDEDQILSYLENKNQLENNKEYYGLLKVKYTLNLSDKTKNLFDIDPLKYVGTLFSKTLNPLSDMYEPNKITITNNKTNELEYTYYMVHVDSSKNVTISPEFKIIEDGRTTTITLTKMLFASDRSLDKFNYYNPSDINNFYIISDIEQEQDEEQLKEEFHQLFIPKQTVLFEPKSIDKKEFVDAKGEYGLTYYVYKCDINQDGACNSLNTSELKKHIEGTKTLNGIELILADINGDGTVNDDDREQLTKYLESHITTGLDATYLYSWTFDKDSIKNTDVPLNLQIKFDNNEIINKIKNLYGDIDGTYLSFSHNGTFPGKASISLNLNNKYESSTKLNLYYFNEKEQKLELIKKELQNIGGIVTFEIEHASNYIITTKTISGENNIINNEEEKKEGNPKTGVNTNYLILGLVMIGGIGIYIYGKKHNKFPQI